MNKIDKLDVKLLYELTKDCSTSIPKLSKKLDVNLSVLYSRIKRLFKKGIIEKFTIVINDSLLGISVKSIVGINSDPKFKESIHKRLMGISEITSISEVAGRFNIMITISIKNLETLHNIVAYKIGKIDGISSTEIFIELKKTQKEPEYITSLF